MAVSQVEADAVKGCVHAWQTMLIGDRGLAPSGNNSFGTVLLKD